MNPFHRLHALRMENDQRGYEMDEMRPRFQRLADRHTNGLAPVAVSAFQLFQTPPPLATRLVSLLGLKGGERILEPSAGLGRILDALHPFNPSEVVAVEMAAECAGALFQQDRENVTIKQRDFLTCSPDELGTFDSCAMNPPFHMRADIKHILHARQFMRPGSTLAALCLDTHHRHTSLRSLATTWEPIPAGTFKGEGTQVATVLLTIHA